MFENKSAMERTTLLDVGTAFAQKSFCAFLPKQVFFILPSPYVLKAFPGSSPFLELQTQPQNEQARRELGWELSVDFRLCATESGMDF